MAPLGNIPFLAAAKGSPYKIPQSLRFNSGDSAYLNRTPGSAGDRTLWTWSAWIKRSGFGSTVGLFGSYAAANNTDYFEILFASGNTLLVQANSQVFLGTSQVFRDPSAWYHIVIAVDTSNATADDRIKLYVNGEQVTAFAIRNNPSSGGNLGINQAALHRLGRRPSGTDYFNGYMAEVNFIDGSALGPDSFGKTNVHGVWTPVGYAGSYTGNSFYLKFASGDGTDSSGLSNTWTANNFTTSGTGTDVMSDTPTTNWCTLNPLSFGPSNADMYEGNLRFDQPTSSTGNAKGTIAVSSGKWYWEVTPQTTATANVAGGILGAAETSTSSQPGNYATGYSYYSTGETRHNGVDATYGASYGAGDVIGTALDLDAGTLVFYKNGVSQGTAYSSVSGTFVPAIGDTSTGSSSGLVCNFGQRAFEYTPPTGFKALNTSNLPAPDIADGSDYFDTLTYTGDGTASRSLTGVGFAPDFVWIKNRDVARSNSLHDIVRGTNEYLISNSSGAELTDAGLGLASFDSDGFTLGTSTTSGGGQNGSGEGYVAWNWLAGNGTSSISAGSIDGTNPTIASTVSANPTAGFSIVSYTGTGAGASVGHGLGVAPSLLLFKNRDSAENWAVWHSALDATTGEHLGLNQTNAVTTNSVIFNSTAPTSTVFSVGNNGRTGLSGNDYIAYCFTEVEGYSKFGSYTGNGLSGDSAPFVWCGFKPAWVMIKESSNADSWLIMDSKRSTYNVVGNTLAANSSGAENVDTGGIPTDFLSNGFKCRGSGGDYNASGDTYIFAAFAENPFGGSGISPATAR